jgi:hypothetical protein
MAAEDKYVDDGAVVAWHGGPSKADPNLTALVQSQESLMAKIGVSSSIFYGPSQNILNDPVFQLAVGNAERPLWTFNRDILESRYGVRNIRYMKDFSPEMTAGDSSIVVRRLRSVVFVGK